MKMTVYDWTKNPEILKNLPEILKVLKDHLIVVWTDQDIKMRDHMNEDHAKMDRDEFENIWGKKTYDFRKSSNRTITKNIIRAAENYVIGIVNRIEELCGKIIDCSQLIIKDCSINGIVKCENGLVKINTIMFPNSSRLHHNVKIEAVEPQEKPQEKHDLNYWLDVLDKAIGTDNLILLKRAKSAIKEIKELMKGESKRKYYKMQDFFAYLYSFVN